MAPIPTVVFLHALGASGRSFDRVAAELGPQYDVLALDLPGFGTAPASTGTTVAEMAEHVIGEVAAHLGSRPEGWPRWLLVGHSMGGKIATVVAARTLRGAAPLFGLAGVVLLAASPPSPEPMSPDKRAEMLGWVADGSLDEAAVTSFIEANVGAPLAAPLDALERADLHRTDPEAWRAWLLRGSREDWSAEVRTLDLPATILGGDADADLGAAAQPHLNGLVYPQATVQVLAGAGHLLPLERPVEVAAAITTFWTTRAGLGPVTPPAAAATIASARTGARTRAALARRALADDPAYAAQALTPTQLEVLRVLAAEVVPQDGPAIDLAARVDAQLAAGAGNGWRFDGMPADVEAYPLALDALADLPSLTSPERVERLTAVAAGLGYDGSGKNGSGKNGSGLEPVGGLDAEQLAHWFEDACDDLVRAWLAHPASLTKVGYDGYANGGDGLRLQGFTLLSLGAREDWEPVGLGSTAANPAAAGVIR